MRKPLQQIFSEFAGTTPSGEEYLGTGDVKYHLGTSYDRPTATGKRVHLSLLANPSHLEVTPKPLLHTPCWWSPRRALTVPAPWISLIDNISTSWGRLSHTMGWSSSLTNTGSLDCISDGACVVEGLSKACRRLVLDCNCTTHKSAHQWLLYVALIPQHEEGHCSFLWHWHVL